MKKLMSVIMCIGIVMAFGLFAMGSSDSEDVQDQGSAPAQSAASDNAQLGDYSLEIISCRLAKDYSKKPVIIVKYKFTNAADEPASFTFAFDDEAYQDGVGLNGAYFIDDSYHYDAGNQNKEIKKGASIEVEVAYELNDTTTNVEVEVKELFSFNDATIKKTFTIK